MTADEEKYVIETLQIIAKTLTTMAHELLHIKNAAVHISDSGRSHIVAP